MKTYLLVDIAILSKLIIIIIIIMMMIRMMMMMITNILLLEFNSVNQLLKYICTDCINNTLWEEVPVVSNPVTKDMIAWKHLW